jgi:hypothetical protein
MSIDDGADINIYLSKFLHNKNTYISTMCKILTMINKPGYTYTLTLVFDCHDDGVMKYTPTYTRFEKAMCLEDAVLILVEVHGWLLNCKPQITQQSL